MSCDHLLCDDEVFCGAGVGSLVFDFSVKSIISQSFSLGFVTSFDRIFGVIGATTFPSGSFVLLISLGGSGIFSGFFSTFFSGAGFDADLFSLDPKKTA